MPIDAMKGLSAASASLRPAGKAIATLDITLCKKITHVLAQELRASKPAYSCMLIGLRLACAHCWPLTYV